MEKMARLSIILFEGDVTGGCFPYDNAESHRRGRRCAVVAIAVVVLGIGLDGASLTSGHRPRMGLKTSVVRHRNPFFVESNLGWTHASVRRRTQKT